MPVQRVEVGGVVVMKFIPDAEEQARLDAMAAKGAERRGRGKGPYIPRGPRSTPEEKARLKAIREARYSAERKEQRAIKAAERAAERERLKAEKAAARAAELAERRAQRDAARAQTKTRTMRAARAERQQRELELITEAERVANKQFQAKLQKALDCWAARQPAAATDTNQRQVRRRSTALPG